MSGAPKNSLEAALKAEKWLFMNVVGSWTGLMVSFASAAILSDHPTASFLWYGVPFGGLALFAYNANKMMSNLVTIGNTLVSYLKEDEHARNPTRES